MFTPINVDVCKTPDCKNLGVMNSPDYVVQGSNVLCQECGFLFPIISTKSLNTFRTAVNRPWKSVARQCPGCGGTSLKRNGFSAQGVQRMLCHHCNKTFVLPAHSKTTIRQAHLATLIKEGVAPAEICRTLAINNTTLGRELAHLSHQAHLAERDVGASAFDVVLSTRAFYVKFNGGNSRLYILVTAEENSGRVVAISTNYCPHPVEAEYQYHSQYEERLPPGTLMHLVQRKEMLTMRRHGVLFNIDYGPATLHRYDRGMLVKPVLPAYRHFGLVRLLIEPHSLNVQHNIDHECFILGGCLVANLADIQQGRCHISFVREWGASPPVRALPPRLFYSGGIRNNVWRTYSTRDYAMAVCNLTGCKNTHLLRHVTLKSATDFIQYVQNHSFFMYLNKMSPANLTAVLEHIKHEYNCSLLQ
ncbi:MAG: cytoplasmic protein [Kluyvera sp.]|uniref:transposase n=1 Tax=Kluyvera sp. TaxID=1538228 RepID=UPI003A853D8F